MLSSGLLLGPGVSLGFSLLGLRLSVAEAERKVPTTASPMLVLSLSVVPWTLSLSPPALPKHHLLAMSLEEWWQQDGVFFRAGGEGQVKRQRSMWHINSVKKVLALLK